MASVHSRLKAVLLDVDGVLLDPAQGEQDWTRLAGPAFCPILGGQADAWLEHQQTVWQRVWQQACREDTGSVGLRGLNLSRWWDRVFAEWIAQTCCAVGVCPPPTFEARVDAAERVLAFYYLHTDALVPGAAEAIGSLSRRFPIHTASGNPSWIVQKVIERLGVADVVGQLFGSDLVGVQKGHDRFYPSILEQLGIAATEALVVDDGDGALCRAARWGIRVVKVGDRADQDAVAVIASIADLPRFLESLP